MAALKESGWREEEFEWAKGAVVGGMIMHRESTSSRMNSLTRRVMSTNADMTHAERVELVKSIKLEDVMRFTEMLVDAEWSGAMIHPNGKGFSLEPYLKF
jgi:predicted Zn-dependent peptidase